MTMAVDIQLKKRESEKFLNFNMKIAEMVCDILIQVKDKKIPVFEGTTAVRKFMSEIDAYIANNVSASTLFKPLCAFCNEALQIMRAELS